MKSSFCLSFKPIWHLPKVCAAFYKVALVKFKVSTSRAAYSMLPRLWLFHQRLTFSFVAAADVITVQLPAFVPDVFVPSFG